MSLTPKNWKEFQHYKDRSPPWIKLHRPLLDNFEFHRLPVASRALAPMLWLLAAEYENGTITASNDEIAFRLRMSLDDLIEALKPLICAEFFSASEPLAECKRGAMPEREKEAEKEQETESRSIEVDRPARAPDPKQIDLEEAIAAASSRAPSRFEEFWRAYPRREGPNPRKPAESKFNALVKSGLDPEMMIAEAKKLAGAEASRGNVGTRFIPQAVTWLNQQRWADHAAVAFLADQAGGMTIEQAVQMFAKIGRWSKYAPVGDISQAPPELLAKFGLAPDGRKLEPIEP